MKKGSMEATCLSALCALVRHYVSVLTPDVASSDEDEMKEFLVKMATEAEGDTTFNRKDLVEKARGWGLLKSVVGLAGEKDDPSLMKRFGRQLQRHRGREYMDMRGRMFRFSRRRQKQGATYPLVFLASSTLKGGA